MARKQVLSLTEAEFADLLERSASKNLTPREFIMRTLWPQKISQPFQFFFSIIDKEVAILPVNSEYNLKEIIGISWQKVPKNMGGQLGKAYKRRIETDEITNVEFVRLNREGHAVYTKIK